MRCPRCGGLTVREDVAGVYERGWRCVNCGAIGDFVIQGNQRRMAHLLVRRASIVNFRYESANRNWEGRAPR
jgi:uncharacterized Zn finger protein